MKKKTKDLAALLEDVYTAQRKQASKPAAKKKPEPEPDHITSFIPRSITPKDRATLNRIKLILNDKRDSVTLAWLINQFFPTRERLERTESELAELRTQCAEIFRLRREVIAGQEYMAKLIAAFRDISVHTRGSVSLVNRQLRVDEEPE